MSEQISSNPLKDSYHFPAISAGLERAGTYLLQYALTQPLSSQSPSRSLQLSVHPGPAAELIVQVSVPQDTLEALCTMWLYLHAAPDSLAETAMALPCLLASCICYTPIQAIGAVGLYTFLLI